VKLPACTAALLEIKFNIFNKCRKSPETGLLRHFTGETYEWIFNNCAFPWKV
jgi:hypothetical protein